MDALRMKRSGLLISGAGWPGIGVPSRTSRGTTSSAVSVQANARKGPFHHVVYMPQIRIDRNVR